VVRLFEAIKVHLRTLARPLAESLFALFIGLLVGAGLMLAFGYSPIDGYTSMLKGFGIFDREGLLAVLAIFAIGLLFIVFIGACWAKIPQALAWLRRKKISGRSIISVIVVVFIFAFILYFIKYLAIEFLDKVEILEMLAYSVPLMLTAITFAVGMRAGLFNIGAEGQVYMGAVAAAWIGGHLVLPAGLHLFAATAFAMLIGAAWALLPAILKIGAGVHEVISTIMLNWVAFFHVPYLIINRFAGVYAERTAAILPSARYNILELEGATASLTAVIFVALAACFVVYILLWRTRAGYELRLVGDNPDAARYAGINIRRVMLYSFIIGGMAAGLAGASQVIGRPLLGWTLPATLGTVFGLGFWGIGIAVVGRNHPIGGIFAALLFAGMLNGAKFMEYDVGISSELVIAIQGVIIVALAVPALLAMSGRGVRRLTAGLPFWIRKKIRRRPR